MTIPEVSLAIKDGALGVVPPNGNQVLALVGMCSSGTVNQVYSFGDIQTLKDTLGTGPLVEAAAAVLREAGGPVHCVRVNGTTAASVGSVTKVGTGSSVLTTTGTSALDTYPVKVKIITGGANPASGDVTFKYSLDDGINYGPTIALPTSGVYAIAGTGVTLNFSAASLVAGDVYSFATVAPSYSVSEFNSAYDALVGTTGITYFGVAVIGEPADGTAAAALFSAFDTKLAGSATAFRYLAGFMQAQNDTDGTVKTGLASVTSTRLVVCHGRERLQSALAGYQTDRPILYSVLARAAAVPPSEDLARVASNALVGVSAVSRNEANTPTMDDAGFTTLRSHVGLPGFYISNCNLFSAPTSDYQYLQHRRVMDIACTAARQGFLRFLNDSVRVKTSNGTILEEDARFIEAYVEGLVRAVVTQPGYASDVSVSVDRTTNVLSTSTLKGNIRLIPLGYNKAIDLTIGYFNPALKPQTV